MDLNGVLLRAVELGSTDVHLKFGQPPVCRIDGDLTPMADARPLDESALISVLETIGRRAPEKLQHFHLLSLSLLSAICHRSHHYPSVQQRYLQQRLRY